MIDVAKCREFEHEVRNSVVGVALEIKRIRFAMWRLEQHLIRMDRACESLTQQTVEQTTNKET